MYFVLSLWSISYRQLHLGVFNIWAYLYWVTDVWCWFIWQLVTWSVKWSVKSHLYWLRLWRIRLCYIISKRAPTFWGYVKPMCMLYVVLPIMSCLLNFTSHSFCKLKDWKYLEKWAVEIWICLDMSCGPTLPLKEVV